MDFFAENIVAKRYAVATLNVYGYKNVLSVLDNYEALYLFLDTHSRILFYFKIPTLDKETILNGMLQLYKRFSIPPAHEALLHTLSSHGRMTLIKNILQHIIDLTKELDHREYFVIKSSHEITETQKTTIINFLQHRTGNCIVPSFILEKKLIAGIKLISKTHLWEESIAKSIKRIQ